MTDATRSGPRPTWADAFFAVRDEMRRWIDDALQRHGATPYQGGHDEGTFISSWFGFHQLFGEPRVLEFARFLRDGFAAWSREHMLHGFYREGEAHHQTEIYTFFLARLWQVDPDDETAELIVDAAHHIGNWVEGCPDWYDWDDHRFLSWHIGTERVGAGGSSGYEVPDHFRLIQIALVAHRITGDPRYLDLSTAYADRWARAILDAPVDEPPIILRSGDSVADESEVLSAIGAHHQGDSPLERVEPHVPAGTADVMLDLFALTGEERYAQASRRLCEAMLPALADPYSNPPGALLNRYRAATGDTSLDDAIADHVEPRAWHRACDAAEELVAAYAESRRPEHAYAARELIRRLSDSPEYPELLIEIMEDYTALTGDELYLDDPPYVSGPVEEFVLAHGLPSWIVTDQAGDLRTLGRLTRELAERFPELEIQCVDLPCLRDRPVLVVDTLSREPVSGIGKRRDMVRWASAPSFGTLDEVEGPPPPSLMLAWQITGDHDLAAPSLRMVADRLALARTSLRDGRRHGCAGSTISAVASGHGRDGGYGNITGAFLPLAGGMLRDLCQERPTVRFRQVDGTPHLPDEVASLVRLLAGQGAEARLWNDAEEPIALDIAGLEGEWTRVDLAAGETMELHVR